MNEKSIVSELLLYIEENLQEDLSLDRIEEKLNYSKFYINRLFAREVGCTIHKYIQTRRLTEAARQLVETDIPLSQVAQEAHYNSQQAFTLAFHQVYLCTPQEYRRNGIFHPKQLKITMRNHSLSVKNIYWMAGGKMAA